MELQMVETLESQPGADLVELGNIGSRLVRGDRDVTNPKAMQSSGPLL